MDKDLNITGLKTMLDGIVKNEPIGELDQFKLYRYDGGRGGVFLIFNTNTDNVIARIGRRRFYRDRATGELMVGRLHTIAYRQASHYSDFLKDYQYQGTSILTHASNTLAKARRFVRDNRQVGGA